MGYRNAHTIKHIPKNIFIDIRINYCYNNADNMGRIKPDMTGKWQKMRIKRRDKSGNDLVPIFWTTS
jgi:hypothetical protein